MGTLKDAQKVAVAEIVKYGDKITLPEKMTLPQAIDVIERRMEFEEEVTTVVEMFAAFPWDGAFALEKVLQERYGWVPQRGHSIAVEVAYGVTKNVPWGEFTIPNVEGTVNCDSYTDEMQLKFRLIARVQRKNEAEIREVYAAVRETLKTHSIYKGKAIRISFIDSDGDEISVPQPTFLDTDAIDPSKLVLSRHLEKAVNTNLFVPITRIKDCIANGMPAKRGVLLGGPFGTGKTMIAHIASKYAVDAGITFLYIRHAAELPYAIQFARQYQSPGAAIFCEDIDRAMGGERDDGMDQILNTIDGIDSKNSNIIVVLTTNALENIHPAMLRPGRLDAVLDITAPDAEAIERLIRVYAGKAVNKDADLVQVGKTLAGNIPAVIAEVVKRAKLAQLSLQEPGTMVRELSAQALLDAAVTIQAQVALLSPKVAVKSSLEESVKELVQGALNGEKAKIDYTERGMKAMLKRLDLKA